jgi:hypothetical protein
MLIWKVLQSAPAHDGRLSGCVLQADKNKLTRKVSERVAAEAVSAAMDEVKMVSFTSAVATSNLSVS